VLSPAAQHRPTPARRIWWSSAPRVATERDRSVESPRGDRAAPSAGPERQTAGSGRAEPSSSGTRPRPADMRLFVLLRRACPLVPHCRLAGCGVARVAPAGLDREGMHAHGHPPRWQRGASPDRRPRAVAGRAARAPVAHRARDGCWRRRARRRSDVHPAGPFPASCDARLRARDVQCPGTGARPRERPAQCQRTQHRGGPGATAARGAAPARWATACVSRPVTRPPAFAAPRPGQGPGPQTPWTLGARELRPITERDVGWTTPGVLPEPERRIGRGLMSVPLRAKRPQNTQFRCAAAPATDATGCDALARSMQEMSGLLAGTPGCVAVEPPYFTEDGARLVGISRWESRQAFLASGITLLPPDETVEGETRPRERFFLEEAETVGPQPPPTA